MRVGMIDTQAIRQRWESVGSKLDERGRRVFAAGEVRAAGWGGLEAVSAITGLARSTIGRGLKDLDAAPLPKGRERRKGGGRRHLSSRDATLIEDLRSVIEPATLGDPMRPLLWVSKSHDKVADALQKQGHEISASSVKRLLPTLGYSRQSNRKANEGSKHPDRNAQFEHINAKAIAAQATGQPVISVDTKKKELIGNYKNGGTDYRPKGDPRRVKVHDLAPGVADGVRRLAGGMARAYRYQARPNSSAPRLLRIRQVVEHVRASNRTGRNGCPQTPTKSRFSGHPQGLCACAAGVSARIRRYRRPEFTQVKAFICSKINDLLAGGQPWAGAGKSVWRTALALF